MTTTTEYLRRDDAAKFLKISKGTLANWASAGRGPKYSKVGRIPVYSKEELQRWVEARTVEPLD